MVTKAFAAIGVFGVLVSMAAVAWPAPGAQATINSAINFQGKLANANGTNIPNGTYNLEFKLYTAGAGCVGGGSSPCGGTLQWTEDWLRNSSQGVTVTDGIFQVNLGSITSLPAIFNNNTIWMSINLGNTNATCTPFTSCSGDGEMLPFVRFTASPYALNSDALQGLHATDFAQLSPGSAQSGFLNVNGNVTSGATVAAATGLQAPLVDTATAVALNVGTGIASSVKHWSHDNAIFGTGQLQQHVYGYQRRQYDHREFCCADCPSFNNFPGCGRHAVYYHGQHLLGDLSGGERNGVLGQKRH